MERTYKPGFIYIKSEELKQEIAFRKKDGWVFCEDGVRYSPQEMTLFENAGATLDIMTHNVKKVLGGEVVKIEQPAKTNGEGKSVERTGGNDKPDNSGSGEKIQGAGGACTEKSNGDFAIY